MSLDYPDYEWHHTSIGVKQFWGELHAALGANNPTSLAWPTANLAILVPLYIRTPVVAQQLWWHNGGTLSGSVDMALYDETGTNQLAHAGSTLQAGTEQPQAKTITGGKLLQPGRYWMALVLDNITGQIRRWPGSSPGANITDVQRMLGVQQMAAAFPLPAVLTFAQAVNFYVPNMGISLSTLTM